MFPTVYFCFPKLLSFPPAFSRRSSAHTHAVIAAEDKSSLADIKHITCLSAWEFIPSIFVSVFPSTSVLKSLAILLWQEIKQDMTRWLET